MHFSRLSAVASTTGDLPDILQCTGEEEEGEELYDDEPDDEDT